MQLTCCTRQTAGWRAHCLAELRLFPDLGVQAELLAARAGGDVALEEEEVGELVPVDGPAAVRVDLEWQRAGQGSETLIGGRHARSLGVC